MQDKIDKKMKDDEKFKKLKVGVPCSVHESVCRRQIKSGPAKCKNIELELQKITSNIVIFCQFSIKLYEKHCF